MRNTPGRTVLLLAAGGIAACTDAARSPLAPRIAPPDAPRQTVISLDRWNIADVEADFGGHYSLDTTQAGSAATYYVAPADGTTTDRTFCRDHFKPIDLWWDGGYGLMRFHLDPPLLFVGYHAGTYRSPRGLVFRKAIYETIEPAEAVDPSGNVWRFQGRFNALCRGGEFEVGPLVFGGQVLVSQNPISRPVLVRRGENSGAGCGESGGDEYYTESYDPYSPAPDSMMSPNCGGSSGEGDGSGSDEYTCSWDYVTIEITYDGGKTWHQFWSGWAQVCEKQSA